MAHMNGEVIDVSETLVGGACQNELCEVRATRFNGIAVYHVLLKPASTGTWILYHSEQRVVEELPRIGSPVFSPDSRWLAATVEEDEGNKLWLRRVHGGMRQTEWSPDSAQLAVQAYMLDPSANPIEALFILAMRES